MFTRRKLFKYSLLPILYQFVPAISEANFLGPCSPLPSQEIEDTCLGIISDALINSRADYCYYRLITALGEMGNPSGIPLLMKELNDPGRECEKEIIAYYLDRLGEPKGIDYLLKSLASNECVFKRDAYNFLCGLHGIPIPIISEKEETLSPEEIKKKIMALRDSDDPVDRSEVVRLMGRSRDQSYIPHLQGLLRDDLGDCTAPVELYHLDDPTIIPFLIGSLNGKNDYLPEAAFTSLCEIGDQSFIPALEKAMKVHEEDRISNIISLYKSSYSIQTMRYLLREHLYDSCFDVRIHAAIGYYYKQKPAFYDSIAHWKRKMYVSARLLPCDSSGNGCDVKNCALFKDRPEMDVEALLNKVVTPMAKNVIVAW